VSFNNEEVSDLLLWSRFLLAARQGISMNLLTLRKPSKVGLSNSCPFGMGGFTWQGRAWRLRIPPECLLHGVSKANNVLESLAMAVTIWLLLVDCKGHGQTDEYLLALGDNTSAIGWVFRSSRLKRDSPYYEPVQTIAHKIALLVTESGQCLCPQHIRGESNSDSNWLSFTDQIRDGKPNPVAFDDPPDDVLTNRLHSSAPQLIPTDSSSVHFRTKFYLSWNASCERPNHP
jgi:hypothetical protein